MRKTKGFYDKYESLTERYCMGGTRLYSYMAVVKRKKDTKRGVPFLEICRAKKLGGEFYPDYSRVVQLPAFTWKGVFGVKKGIAVKAMREFNEKNNM